MGRLKGLMEVRCIGWEKAAGTSMGLAITAINMATLGATALRCQSKTRLPSQQRRGSATKGGGKDQGGKWSGTGGKGWDYGKGFGNQWGQRLAVKWEQVLWKVLRWVATAGTRTTVGLERNPSSYRRGHIGSEGQ